MSEQIGKGRGDVTEGNVSRGGAAAEGFGVVGCRGGAC